ncbi:MAG: CotH kinase family protein [Bacteroidetes bacterium]|nr:CotH kinase family protein [Bacteroidota bacterium]
MTSLLRKVSALLFICFLAIPFSEAQIVINEISPSNITGILNSNGQHDDWIELYNSGGSSVNLSGYGLTDDSLKPFRFTFPSQTIAAGGRILVFASDSNSSVIVNHWEMGVNGIGSWKYASGSAGLDTNWRNLSFNEAPWSTGNGGIGFGDSDDGTSVAVGTSVMMRKSFNIPDTSQILKAVLMMDYDDGFVAYLNGVEITRANLGVSGTRPNWNDLAMSSHEANNYQGLPLDSFFIDPTFLKTVLSNGTNVLAVETHNVTASSTDLSSIPYFFFGMKSSGSTFSAIPSWFHPPSTDFYNAKFKLSRTGETVHLYNPGGTRIDWKLYPAMGSDNSYGRKPDGSGSWCLFGTPTPNSSNNSSTCYTAYAAIPIFSVTGGFYSSTRTLTLSTSTPGGVIRYTSNGDDPIASDPVYSSAISISSTKTIRAKVFASGFLPSPVVTNSYFINESIHLPVFSITTDSLNLWDYNTGIYVMGPNAETTSPYFGANFWQDWEKPATIEYYDKDKIRIVRFDADISVYGNYSRAKPQKSIEIKLGDKYGTGSVNYPFFTDKPYIDKMDDIILRNSGTDWNKVHFRDALMERVMKNTWSGYLGAEPTVMFLNGEFWGVFTIHENHDENWMDYNYGLSKSQVDYLKEDGSSITLKEGSDATFWTMYNYATTQTPITQQFYDYMNSVLDLRNYADYFIAQTYYNNGDWIGDWTNNIKLWRPNASGSKWRYMLYDTDFGFGLQGSVNDDRLAIARNPASFSHSSEMFDAMLKNPTFKKYFINRYADLINTNYLPSNVNAVLHQFQDSMAYDMPAHFAKWGNNMSTWQTNINGVMSFVNARPTIMRDNIKTDFSLAGKVTLTLQTSPAGSGRIEISTITPTTYPWSGVYFNGNPVTITAIPNPGYTFDHWRSNVTISSNNPNQSVTYNFTANDVITAYFTGSAAVPKITISEFNYNADSALNAGDWMELKNFGSQSVDISGWKLSDGADNHMFVFPTGTVISAGGYLVVMEDSIKFTTQFPSVSNKLGLLGFNFSNGGDEVRLFDHLGNLYLSFFYSDLAPWPLTPDGGGYTCELLNVNGNLNDGNNWFAGCVGGSPGRAYSSLLSAPIDVTGNTTFCNGGNVQLSATNDPNYTYQWKRNNTSIVGATSAVYTAVQGGTYTVVVSSLGCSVVSDPTIVTVVSQSPDPVTTSNWRCGAGSLTLNATSTDTVFWYDAPNGNLLGFGDSLVTPLLSATTTYYAKTSRNCPSNAVATIAQILQQTAAPVTSDVTRCGPGIATLTATDTASMRWYNAPLAGGLLETGGTFVTNFISNDTVFYVEAGTVCPSSRIEAHVYITSTADPEVSDNSRCGNGTVVLTAISSAPVSWFNVASGGSSLGTGLSFTTPSLTATDTFYAEANSGCPSARIRAIAIVNPIVSAPTASNGFSCGPGIITLSATSTEQVYWYDAASNGNLLYTGSIFDTPFLSSSTTYYAEAGYTCRSVRTAVQANINTIPAAPTASNVSRCGTGTVTLSAVSPELITWYDAPTAGNLLFTGDQYTTPSISTTTTYYAEAGTTCKSPTRTAVQAIINAVPSAPSASNVSRCGTGTVTLTATSLETIYWYSAPSGGTLLFTGASYTTPSISTTTTYYVETGNNCRSSRISVQAIVNSAPAAPTASDVSRCGTGTVTLNATSSATINWYSASSGGTFLGTGATYTTPSISSTTIYYAEANNGCSSANRTAVQAIISPIPAAPSASNVSRCGTGTVTLTASSLEQVYWYSAASGGTLLATNSSYTTPSISTTTTYYAEAGNTCRSATRTAVQAIISPAPAPPVSSDVSRCGTGTVTLTATSSETIYWYSAASGGTLLATASSYTTPSISSTTTYYVETGNTCRSARIAVDAIIATPPAAPSASNVSRCGPGTVTLNASSPEQITWFTGPSGGSSIFTGSAYTTPVISTTTTYYAEAGSGCQSLTRTAVQAIITALPSAPTASNVSRCGPGTVTLTASSPEQVYWYSAASGGTLLVTNSSYTTPSISSTTTYYAEAGNTCRSATRTAAQAIITPLPNPPSASDVSRCGTGTVTLTATSTETIYWYSAASGGTLLATASSYTTPSISSTTTYYVETGNTCRSNRIAVDAVVTTPPAAPGASNVSRCGPGTVSLTASSPEQISWFTASSGGSVLFVGATFTTPFISSTTTYYAEAGSGCQSLTRTAVQAIVSALPAAPTASNVSRCGPGTVTLTASSPEQVYWYSAASGGTLLVTNSSYTTPSISSTTTYYAEAGNTCRSATRTAVQAIVNPIPSPPVANDVSRCGPGTVTLTATSSETIYWYSAASGGTLLATAASYTTPSISSSTTYYVETGNTCRSARVAVDALVTTAPAAPLASNGSRCGPGTVSISASSPEQISWFTSSSGGTALFVGTTYTTPSISTTTTYYAEAGSGCQSLSRTAVLAIIDPLPAAPTGSGVSRCGAGTVTLSASSPEQIYWYSAASGGTLLATSSSYTTPVISSTTTYYAEAGNTCRSATRTAIQAIINAIPAAPQSADVSRCGSGTVTLTATSPEQVYWYSAATGGALLATSSSYTTPSLSVTTTYYAEAGNTCRSATRTAVQAIIGTVPSPPLTSNASRCGTGTVTLSATSPEQVYWYSAASGGTLLGTGLSYTTPSIASTTTYYLETGDVCRSTRISVDAVINPIPSPPSSSSVSRCGNGTVTLTASSPETIYWYDAPSGGNLLTTGTTYTTPSLSTTTTYYLETGNVCRSSRVAVQAIITSAPSAPVLTDGVRCGTGAVILTASSTSRVNWFDVANGGVLLDTGLTFITPSISSTTTYYAEAGAGCNSIRVPVQAIVNTAPAAPLETMFHVAVMEVLHSWQRLQIPFSGLTQIQAGHCWRQEILW